MIQILVLKSLPNFGILLLKALLIKLPLQYFKFYCTLIKVDPYPKGSDPHGFNLADPQPLFIHNIERKRKENTPEGAINKIYTTFHIFFIYIFIYLFNYLPKYLFTHLNDHLFFFLLYLYYFLSLNQSFYPLIYTSFYLSIYISIYL